MAKPRQTRPASRPAPPPAGRRTARLFAFAAVALVALGALGWFALRSRGPGAIVLISIDTLRADRLPVYGHAAGRTPAIDAFAREAVLFERAYSHAPQTLPAHASMLTGLLPFDHGVRDNLGFTLPHDKPLLPELLQKSGYKTGGFVSSYVIRAATGLARGFDVYDDRFPDGAVDRSPGQIQRSGEATLAAASAWLDTLQDSRFFLFFHTYEPHMPHRPPARYAGMDPYDGEVAWSDEIVGRLFVDLKRRGWYDNATIIVMADHGEGLGDHGEIEHGLFVYDEAIRVPWIVKRPGGGSSGRRVSTPVQHIDLMPTVLAAAGVPAPGALRGRDLTPLLENRGTVAPQGIYSEALYPRYHFGWSELAALTDERYRYIKAPREELYDLERDPDERHNIAAERAQAAGALRSGLDQLMAGRDIAAPSAVSDEDRERLAALGYVGTQFSSGPREGESLPDPKDMAPVLRQYRDAINLLEARDFPAAAAALAGILKTNRDMTDVWMQYASVLTRLGRDTQALEAYREIVRLKPDEPAGLLGAASALLALQRFDEARAHAQLAVARAPANAHETLARIAIARRNFDEALRQADLAAQADPQLPLPVYVRGLVEHDAKRYEQALPLLLQAREAWSKRTIQTVDLRFYIGDSLAQLERYPEAEKFFQEELQLYPNNVRARAGLAMLYQATGRAADAERAIGQMLAVSPSPRTYQTAAQLWQMFGRPDRAAALRADARSKFGRK